MTKRAQWMHRGGKDASVKARCSGEERIATYERRRERQRGKRETKERERERAQCIAGKKGTRIKGH